MVAMMTMAPVHLWHTGSGLATVGLVVSLHIGAMFGPSPLTGRLINHLGSSRGAAVAGVLLVSAGALAALGGGSPLLLGTAMVVLGLGWNVGVLAGSTALTAGVPAADRPRLEGWGEVGMGVAAAGGGALSGPLVAASGYATLAAAGAAAVLATFPLAARARSPRSTSEPAPAGPAP